MSDKYIEAEKRLAELKGVQGAWEVGQTDEWCRDNAAAFGLITEYSLSIDQYDRLVQVKDLQEKYRSTQVYSEHPDDGAAIRYAIVQTVISLLEGEPS